MTKPATLLIALTFLLTPLATPADDAPPNLEPLLEKLKQREDNVRRQAMRDLAKLGPRAKPAVPVLVERAVGEHLPEMSKEALAAITKIQPDLGPHVATLVESTDPPALIAAANAIGKLGPTEGVRGSYAVRVGIYRYNAKKVTDPAALVAYLAALGEVLPDDKDVVGEVGNAAVLNGNVDVRKQAVQTLGKLGARYPELRNLILRHLGIVLRDRDASVRAAGFATAGAFGADAKSLLKLIAAAEQDESAEARAAAKAAGDAIEKAIRKRP